MRKTWGWPRSGSQLRPPNPKRLNHVSSDKGSLRLAKTPDQALAYVTAQFGGVPSRTRAESLGPATPMPDTMAPLQFPASCLNSQRLKPPSSVTPVSERLVAILLWSKLMRHLKMAGVSDRDLATGNLTFGRDHDVLIAEIIISSAPRPKMNAIRRQRVFLEQRYRRGRIVPYCGFWCDGVAGPATIQLMIKGHCSRARRNPASGFFVGKEKSDQAFPTWPKHTGYL